MLPAMILAAGLGTRLQPLTRELPKPLVPVGDRPAIEHIRAHLVGAGCLRIVLNAFHLSEALARFAATTQVAVSEERELLGTAGGVHHAADALGLGDIFVWNGDILASPDLGQGLREHQRRGSHATLWVRRVPKGEGNIGIAGDGRIVRIRRESVAEEAYGGEFAGIQILGQRLRVRLPKEGCLVTDVLLPALRAGAALHVAELDAFSDIGSLRAYIDANFAWLKARSETRFVAASAQVFADVQSSVVGSYAVVQSPLRRCIVWPNASVSSAAEECILTPTQRIPFPHA